MRLFRLLLRSALLAATAATFAAAAETPVWRIGALTDNYPYSFRGDDGNLQGFVFELTTELERAIGLRFERVAGTTQAIWRDFDEGRLDALQSFAYSAEREQRVDFTVPYLTMSGALFVRAGEAGIRSFADLRGRKVAVHPGSLGDRLMRQAGLEREIVAVESVEQALERLERGEVEATLAARLSGLSIVHHRGFRRVRALEADVPGFDVRYCFAVRKGDAALLARLNEGLAVLMRTGKFDEVYRKWFGHVLPEAYSAAQVMGAVALGLALALAVALWAGARQRALSRRIALQAEALRESEAWHRHLFEGARDGMLVLAKKDGRLTATRSNAAAGRLLGREPGGSPEGDAAAVLAGVPTLAERLRADDGGGTFEFEQQLGDGRWLRVGVGPLGTERLVTLADITEQVDGRRQLAWREEQMRQRQKLEAVGTLARGVAHDFNNLLTTILGSAELVSLRLGPGHPAESSLQPILQAGLRARDLVRQILTFSRDSAPRREVVAVGPLVADTVSLLRPLAAKRVVFEEALQPDLPPILADPVQVSQVLVNIGTNAIQAMGAGGGQLTFSAETMLAGPELRAQHPELAAGRHLRIGIQDTGPGIPADVRSRIFEPFFTTKAPGEGTGLGLSVVLGIVQQHRGTVTVYSQVGRGTLFHVYFPLDAAGVPADGPGAGPGRGEGERVLFVDDDPAIAGVAGNVLRELGYAVEVHTGPAEAWKAWEAAPDRWAVFVSDLTMPGLTGLQLLSRVRERRPRQPFVILSGFFSVAEAAAAKALGATELVHKPLTTETLGRAVRAALAAS